MSVLKKDNSKESLIDPNFKNGNQQCFLFFHRQVLKRVNLTGPRSNQNLKRTRHCVFLFNCQSSLPGCKIRQWLTRPRKTTKTTTKSRSGLPTRPALFLSFILTLRLIMLIMVVNKPYAQRRCRNQVCGFQVPHRCYQHFCGCRLL